MKPTLFLKHNTPLLTGTVLPIRSDGNIQHEAQIISSATCGETGHGLQLFPGMEKISFFLHSEPSIIYAPSFTNDYLKAGEGFASYYSGKTDYGYKVDRVPQTFINLINKLK